MFKSNIGNIKISAVSYLNTLPFLYGLQNFVEFEQLDISLDIPSVCASKLITNQVDIGLVPIAIIPELKQYYIISDYCIGANGNVDSVLLLSEVPLNKIEKIYLDYQSRTSVMLLKILAENYWNIKPEFITANKGYENLIGNKTAGLIIGDRTFSLNKDYKYKYDLAGEWKKFTNMPFVFAAWIANKKIDNKFTSKFNKSLKYGLDNINTVVDNNYKQNINKKVDLYKYLSQNISYNLDESKKKSMELFFSYWSS